MLPDSTSPRAAVPWRWCFGLAIAAAILLAYANSFPGAFFFDDFDGIVNNASIRDLHNWRAVLWPPFNAGIGGRPFANLTMALNYRFGGLAPENYHVVGVAIHLLAALLLFAVVRRTLLRPRAIESAVSSNALPGMADAATLPANLIAFAAALLWALNATQTNVVDYVSQRTEGLMAAFYLLTLYAFIRSAEEDSTGWAVVSVISCLLGMATKEDMATAPAVVLLYDRTFLSGSFLASLRRHAWIYVALASTWILLAFLVYNSHLEARGVGFTLGRSWHEYGMTECRTIVRYLQRSFWPNPLIFDYGPKYLKSLAAAAPSIAILAATLGAAVVALWRWPRAGFCAAAFFILLSPSSSVIPVAEQPCAENRIYLPLAGIAVLLAALTYRAAGRRGLVPLLLGTAALGLGTAARNPAFKSETAIWWDTVFKNPENERVDNNLGNVLLNRGFVELSRPYFEKALQLSPTYADARNNLGVVFLREGKPAEALPQFLAAIKDKKDFKNAQYNLGETYLDLGRTADALAALQADIKIDPENPKVLNNLGIALLDSGRPQESIEAEQRALRFNPNMPEAHYNLGNALGRVGRLQAALAEFDATLKLDPSFAKAENNAGALLLQLGRNQDARRRFESALRINPQYAEARRNLGLVGGKPL